MCKFHSMEGGNLIQRGALLSHNKPYMQLTHHDCLLHGSRPAPCTCFGRSAENTSLDNGGGNRVSEEQIKNYLRKTLGEEAPQPEWGLPEGWGQYLSGKSPD